MNPEEAFRNENMLRRNRTDEIYVVVVLIGLVAAMVYAISGWNAAYNECRRLGGSEEYCSWISRP